MSKSSCWKASPARSPTEDREALAALIEDLRARQRQANDELAPFVAAKRLKKLRRRLAKLVKAVER